MILKDCYLYNYSPDKKHTPSPDSFYLKTCQRQLILSSTKIQAINENVLKERNAYELFLSVICGLESSLLGESEIVAQVKDAYKKYLQSPHRDTSIQRFIEKAFHDSKKIRTHYLNCLSQKPYAYLVKKSLQSFSNQKILILGSGKIASDIIAQLHKNFSLIVHSRNESQITSLQKKFFFNIENNFSNYIHYPVIVNTIGSSTPLFLKKELIAWNEKGLFFLDLSNPSCRENNFTNNKITSFDTFLKFIKETVSNNEEKIISAKKAIEEFASKRYSFTK